MLPLLGLHHVAVICSDYPASKRFYTEVLGPEILAETYRAARDSHKLDLAVNVAAETRTCPPWPAGGATYSATKR